MPGPGHYDPLHDITEQRSPSAKINPHHDGGSPDSRNLNPGPGYYNPEISFVKENGPAMRFAKNKRDFLTLWHDDLS
jgi:hypothetical protein